MRYVDHDYVPVALYDIWVFPVLYRIISVGSGNVAKEGSEVKEWVIRIFSLKKVRFFL